MLSETDTSIQIHVLNINMGCYLADMDFGEDTLCYYTYKSNHTQDGIVLHGLA